MDLEVELGLGFEPMLQSDRLVTCYNGFVTELPPFCLLTMNHDLQG